MVKEEFAEEVSDPKVEGDRTDTNWVGSTRSPARKVDSKGQEYLVHSNGQMVRLSADGTPLPRLRMTKKERLRLRKEFGKIKEMKQKELADKILETPVITPSAVKNA